MRRLLITTGCLVAMFLAASPRIAAQKTQQIFIKVAGAAGPVIDLKAADVTVMEDDVACKVLKVEPAGPTKVQVLVDNGQVTTNPINGLRDGLKAFFEKMPEGVEMSLYTTAPQGRSIVKPTTDKAKLIAGIALITPDRGVGAFFESLLDAVDRADKDKMPGFPVIMAVGSDAGAENLRDNDMTDIQKKVVKDAVTVQVALMLGGSSQSSRTGAQPEIGMGLTRLTGGRYEAINSITRLATLLPEFGERIAQAAARQQNQFKVTYEVPGKRSASPKVGIGVSREGTVTISQDGRTP